MRQPSEKGVRLRTITNGDMLAAHRQLMARMKVHFVPFSSLDHIVICHKFVSFAFETLPSQVETPLCEMWSV